MTTSEMRAESGSQGRPPVTVGDRVITWWDDEPVEYGGPGDSGAFTTLHIQPLSGRTPVRTCHPERVAPADTPIPAQDSRVTVTKRPASEKPVGAAGPWRLTLSGQGPSWHKTKRDGTATGLRQIAILDWHAARAEAGRHAPARRPAVARH